MPERTLWRKIEERLHLLVDESEAVIGLALRDLAGGREVLVNPDEVFPIGSLIKGGILAELIRAASQDRCRLDERIVVTPADRTGGSGVLTNLDDPVSMTLRDLVNLMIIASDNVAANICFDRVGAAQVQSLFREFGLEHTTLARKMMDDAAVLAGQENVGTPREIMKLFVALHECEHHEGRPLTRDDAAEILRILKKPKDDPIRRPLPAGVVVAGKSGHLDGAAADAAIVYLSGRPYILVVMTKYLRGHDGDGVIVGLSKAIYEHLEVLAASTPFGRRTPNPAAARP
ncbi:MAG TPA: serine hydrolase [Bacillota bacterium]|jgi:beta-lactamase class A